MHVGYAFVRFIRKNFIRGRCLCLRLCNRMRIGKKEGHDSFLRRSSKPIYVCERCPHMHVANRDSENYKTRAAKAMDRVVVGRRICPKNDHPEEDGIPVAKREPFFGPYFCGPSAKTWTGAYWESSWDANLPHRGLRAVRWLLRGASEI